MTYIYLFLLKLCYAVLSKRNSYHISLVRFIIYFLGYMSCQYR